jgi:hypothetical protein
MRLEYGICGYCSSIDAPTQGPLADTSLVIEPDLSALYDFTSQWGVLDYMHASSKPEVLIDSNDACMHSDWRSSGIPAHGMPQPKPALKRTNKRDHARSTRHMNAPKESDFGAYVKPEILYVRADESALKAARIAARTGSFN